MLAAPDPATQLMQLGDAEALGVLDQHHGRVGHVDADLDHGRGDEHLRTPGGECRHRLLLLGRAHAAVQQRELVALELCLGKTLELRTRGPQLNLGATCDGADRARRGLLGLLDQRADDVGLATGVEL